jgi:hypothetical protein
VPSRNEVVVVEIRAVNVYLSHDKSPMSILPLDRTDPHGMPDTHCRRGNTRGRGVHENSVAGYD